jgi:hypothetical protein
LPDAAKLHSDLQGAEAQLHDALAADEAEAAAAADVAPA